MRIVGGALKGRRLRAPKGMRTRPTSDRVKVALFNILGSPSPDAQVLDLFAGTGALGLEALSRGCRHGIFVERDAAALSALERNISDLGVVDRAEVWRCDVEVAISRLRKQSAAPAFSWIFLDPPYGERIERALEKLGALCTSDAWVVLEHSARDAAPKARGLTVSDTRRYGDTALTFLRPERSSEESTATATSTQKGLAS